MTSFDKIIGYENEKKELKRIADMLKNPKHYEKLGAKLQNGLLLDGNPGTGKTLMANTLIEASGRKAFVCRKDKPNGSFVEHITEIFEEAKKNAPSIVLLDDMDKFANEDERHKNAEEYVTLQTCIDNVRDFDVFVIATTNDMHVLPDSLVRAGRFDQIMRIERPSFNDAVEIIKHYLKDKQIMSDIDPDYIAKLMCRRSCATIESIINQAATIAGFERRDKIELSDFIEVASSTVFRHGNFEFCKKDIDLSDENSFLAEIVYHEAGHVVANEILVPESVTLVAVGDKNGYTSHFPGFVENDVREDEFRIITLLGGIAAVEQVFGRKGFGGARDLSEAQSQLDWFLRNFGKYGFGFVSCPEHRSVSGTSLNNREVATSAFFEAYYEKTKKLIALNREFLEKIAHELAEKKVLTMYDIQRIKSECKIRKVDVL